VIASCFYGLPGPGHYFLRLAGGVEAILFEGRGFAGPPFVGTLVGLIWPATGLLGAVLPIELALAGFAAPMALAAVGATAGFPAGADFACEADGGVNVTSPLRWAFGAVAAADGAAASLVALSSRRGARTTVNVVKIASTSGARSFTALFCDARRRSASDSMPARRPSPSAIGMRCTWGLCMAASAPSSVSPGVRRNTSFGRRCPRIRARNGVQEWRPGMGAADFT
jgi:hypothetical protein